MSTPENPPAPISRRESLKRAAGALALGLGAPAALAANGASPERSHIKLSLYKSEESRRPEAWVELPHDMTDKLMGEDGLVIIKRVKFDNMEERKSQTFDVREARR